MSGSHRTRASDDATDGSTILWGAFELGEDGTVRARITREDPDGGYLRETRRWKSLEAAEADLGAGFGEVARKAAAAGSTRWRWRP